MRIGRTKKLACDFRGRVRTNRLSEMQALRERHRFRDAIDRRTGGKDKSFHADKPRTAGDQNSHRTSVKMEALASKGRTSVKRMTFKSAVKRILSSLSYNPVSPVDRVPSTDIPGMVSPDEITFFNESAARYVGKEGAIVDLGC